MMREFFHGWRRTVGCITLIMAAIAGAASANDEWLLPYRNLRDADVEDFVLETLRTPYDPDPSDGSWQEAAHESQVLSRLSMVRQQDQTAKTLLKVVDRTEQASLDQRRLAMIYLAGAAPKQVAPLLIKALEAAILIPTERFQPYHEIAVLGLIREDARAAVPVLIKLLDSGDGLARDEALLALVKIGPSSAEVMNAIARRFGQPGESVWSRAVYEVSRYGELAKSLGPTFVQLLESKSTQARSFAALAMVKSGFDETRGLGVLVADLETAMSEDRCHALTALAALGSQAKSTIPKLRKYETDIDEQVATAVRDCIRRIEKDDRIVTHAEEAAKTAAGRQAAEKAAAGLRAAAAPTPRDAKPPAKDDARDGWGEPAGGLRIRVIAVAPDTDEQKPKAPASPPENFANVEDVTFLVELQNVGDKPVVLQGTRCGDSFGPSKQGTSASEDFAPYLFHCEFFDNQGKPIDRPSRTMLDIDAMMSLSNGSAETIPPGTSLVTLIRPTKWDASLWRHMTSGDYRVRVHYRGPGTGVLKEMKRVLPDQPLAGVWSGDVVSPLVSFKIAGNRGNLLPELWWGDAVDGLQAAVEFVAESKTPQARRDTANATFPFGSRLAVHVHVKNVSDEAISFWSETWRQHDQITLIDEDGNETQPAHPEYTGSALSERWTLKPGQVAVLSCITLGIAADDEAAKDFDHPIAAVIMPKPGKYWLSYDLHIKRLQHTDSTLKDGKLLILGKSDWQGTISTRATMIRVRERRAEDDPPGFTARLEFRQPDGKRIERGEFEVFVQSKGRSLLKGELEPATLLVIPECPFVKLMVDVRSPGFEECRFLDVAVEPNEVTPLTLAPSEAVRLRLVAKDGKPVGGAAVRYFNRSKVDAKVGPYPMDGLHGAVWATSNDNGEVVLDTLQKFDPLDKKLGNNIYHFYIEPVDLAPLFIGPVQAGQDLGEIRVGSFLEARGEVRGTPQELAAFSAEWDQPEPMLRGDGKAGWHYAESKPLEVRREGGKLVFHLSHLRPGNLRIVSRFKRGGKPVSHVYSRREPNEDDVVMEIDLKESRDDVVVRNKMKGAR